MPTANDNNGHLTGSQMAAEQRPSVRQRAYLRALAQRTGQTFAWPATRSQASREIRRLSSAQPSSRAERYVEEHDWAAEAAARESNCDVPIRAAGFPGLRVERDVGAAVMSTRVVRSCTEHGALGAWSSEIAPPPPRGQLERARHGIATEHRSVMSALYRTHARSLERVVAATVRTSWANVEDGCSFAWAQLLCREGVERPYAWLVRVAVRETLRLERRQRRTTASLSMADGSEVEFVDVRDPIVAREEVIDACARLRAAALSDRQARMLALQAAGLSYGEIAGASGTSVRTVERQILRGRARLQQSTG